MDTAIPRALLVDDQPTNLEILEIVLADGFQTATAATGKEALSKAPAFRPHVILLDVMMPGIDGYETCRRLRAMPECSGCSIFMVSARAMETEKEAGLFAGADEYVTKPFDPDELLARLLAVCGVSTGSDENNLGR